MSKPDRRQGHSLEIRLANYKQMQAKKAESMGLSVELAKCRTLTQARKLLYGYKRGMSR